MFFYIMTSDIAQNFSCRCSYVVQCLLLNQGKFVFPVTIIALSFVQFNVLNDKSFLAIHCQCTIQKLYFYSTSSIQIFTIWCKHHQQSCIIPTHLYIHNLLLVMKTSYTMIQWTLILQLELPQLKNAVAFLTLHILIQ